MPLTGTLRVQILFVDFQDAAAGHSTEAEPGLRYMERYLEAASYGRLDVSAVALHEWLRADGSYRDYIPSGGQQLAIEKEALRLADPAVNFGGQDIALIVMPSTHFVGGSAGGDPAFTNEGWIATTRVNDVYYPHFSEPYPWGDIAAHEIGHVFGLPDLYINKQGWSLPEAPAGMAQASAEFGIMGLEGFFFTERSDQRFVDVDSRWPGFFGYSVAPEMLAWSRWQLGWLQPEQVRCVEEQGATVRLSPIASPGSGIAMATVQLSDDEMIVMESRRKTGLDAGPKNDEPNGAMPEWPGLVTEGLLVYSVGGFDPPLIKLPGQTGNGFVDDYPILTVGERVTVRGYTITVVSDDGETHTVTITKTDDG